MSRVDVFVPCYNYGRFLRQCVESVLTQEGVDVRVLILDDCSSDDSEQVGRKLAAEDSRVEYRRHAVNRGHIATYREGIDWVGGDYCLLLSADDMLLPGALGRAAAVMNAHPEVGLTHGRTVVGPELPEGDSGLVTAAEVEISTGLDFIRERCRWGRFVDTPTAVGRTAVQKRIGYYRPELPHTGDMDMWLRYAAISAVARINSHQAFYRTHGRNMSGGFRGLPDLAQMKLAFDMFFDGPGRDLPGVAKMRRAANRGIANLAYVGACQAFNREDGALADGFVVLARKADPSGRFAPRWLGLRLKRAIGLRAWETVRAMRTGFLGRRSFTPPVGARP
jgi:glycosyltransferase involved in cell wall biosynthesis